MGILDRLRAMHVLVDDQEHSWQVRSAQDNEVGKGDLRSSARRSRKAAPIDEQRVEDMLIERDEAQVSGNFGLADRILSELHDMGVSVDDQEMTWSFNGQRV